MQIYCGTDIIEVARIEDAINNTKGFKENIYTNNEIECCERIRCQMKYQRYAGRFAAKEAFYKAISKVLVENNLNMSFIDIEIENVEELKNRPRAIILNDDIKKMVEDNNIEIDITISHIKETAVAMAVVKVNN